LGGFVRFRLAGVGPFVGGGALAGQSAEPSAIAISSSTNLAALFSEPAAQHHLGPFVAEFDPAGLYVIDRAVQHDSRQGDREGWRQPGLGGI
jgi:hypothetical protein